MFRVSSPPAVGLCCILSFIWELCDSEQPGFVPAPPSTLLHLCFSCQDRLHNQEKTMVVDSCFRVAVTTNTTPWSPDISPSCWAVLQNSIESGERKRKSRFSLKGSIDLLAALSTTRPERQREGEQACRVLYAGAEIYSDPQFSLSEVIESHTPVTPPTSDVTLDVPAARSNQQNQAVFPQ